MASGQVLQGCLYIARLARRDGAAPAHFRQIRGRNGVDFIGDGHCRERRAMRCNWRQKPFHIFGIEHAADDMGLAFGQSGNQNLQALAPDAKAEAKKFGITSFRPLN